MDFKVVIIESEKGQVQKVFDIRYFSDASDAFDFYQKFNTVNCKENVTPDWYVKALTPQFAG